MSGAFDVDSAVLILVVMPSHCWIWRSTFAPVAWVNRLLTASRVASV
jgi:hypothetical protein